MPTKTLTSQADRGGLQKFFSNGGGSNTIFAIDDGLSSFGYHISGGSGDDEINGSDFTGRGTFNPADADPRTEFGDLLIGGDGSDTISGGLGDDTIYGGNEDGSDASKGQNPAPTNQLSGDFSSLGLTSGEVVIGGNDDIFGGDGATNNIWGDARFSVTYSAGASFTGGNDTLTGGDSTVDDTARNNIFGDGSQAFFTAGGGVDGESFTGGNDTLTGGDGAINQLVGDVGSISGDGTFIGGNDTLIGGANGAVNTMTGDAVSGAGLGSVTGGNDTLISGANANDTMTGDFRPADLDFAAAGAVGGTDTFVFAANNGDDTIRDFETGKDSINLSGTTMSLVDINSSGDLFIDASDDHVSVSNGDLVIDLGEAAGGLAGVNLLTIEDTTQLATTDFDFTALLA